MILRLATLRDQLDQSLGRDARRLRQVSRDSGSCTERDIELLLRAHGVCAQKTSLALDSLRVSPVTPPLAWVFAMDHDGTALADMLITSVAEDAFVGAGDQAPDLGMTAS